MQASFSILVMSIASTAAISLGLEPNPADGKRSVNKDMARFNIDLLRILEEKTRGGSLTEEERGLLQALLADLQLKFVAIAKGKEIPT